MENLNSLLDKKIFHCKTHGELMMKNWGGELWLFFKHPTGSGYR